jgi:hypothetical protein
MKTICLVLLAAAGVWGMSSTNATAFSVVSPDQPPVWFNRAGQKVSQYLTWDKSKGELILNVAYNELQNEQTYDETYYDTFKLHFPTVHFNPSTDHLFVNDEGGKPINIGHLDGSRVELDNGFVLSAHRRNGVVVAMITTDASAR